MKWDLGCKPPMKRATQMCRRTMVPGGTLHGLSGEGWC